MPFADLGNAFDPFGLKELLRGGLVGLGQQTQLQLTRGMEWVG